MVRSAPRCGLVLTEYGPASMKVQFVGLSGDAGAAIVMATSVPASPESPKV
jgi:hypothetical protein